MATRSSNALWIGAIVIVAALTAVELISSRDSDDATESIDSSTTNELSPATQIATGAITEAQNDDETFIAVEEEFATVVDPAADFDPSTFQAPDLVVDLENDIALIEDDIQDDTQVREHIAEQASQTTDTEHDTPTTDLQTASINDTAVLDDSESDGILTDTDLNDESVQAPQTQDISHHLAEAEQAMKELRLTTPEGNNAYEHYQAVLALDANNAAAQAGLQEMVDMYIYFVEKAIADDKPRTAIVYLQRAESLQPELAKLKALRAELE